MTVSRSETEILDQPHQVWAEGTSDIEPSEIDIKNLMKSEGYLVFDIEIWYDDMQGFFRWNCDIIKNKTNE